MARDPGDPGVCRRIEPDPAWLTREVRDGLARAHRFEGYAQPGDPPKLFFVSEMLPGTRWIEPLFAVHSVCGELGALLTVIACSEGTPTFSRACVWSDVDAFAQLQSGRCHAVIVHADRIVAAFELRLARQTCNANPSLWNPHLARVRSHFEIDDALPFLRHWQLVAGHRPRHPHPGARYWDGVGHQAFLHAHLDAAELLSIGWARRFMIALGALDNAIATVTAGGPFGPCCAGDRMPAAIASFAAAVDAPDASALTLLDHLAALHAQDPRAPAALTSWLDPLAKACERAGRPGDHQLLTCAIDAYYAQPELTREGARVAWMPAYRHDVQFLDLDPDALARAGNPHEYWERLPSTLPSILGELVGGDEMPARFEAGNDADDDGDRDAAWDEFPIADSVAEASASADALIEEALAAKQWSLPWGALFQLSVGPFTYLEAYERTGSVSFVARTPRSEFAMFHLDLRPDLDPPYPMFGSLPGAGDRAGRIRAAIKLLLAALVRDFWVVERRETVFDARQRSRSPVRVRRRTEDPVIVYLPRVRYARRPDLTGCAARLDHAERRAHFVAGHLRRAATASPHQLLLAQHHGVRVPEGFTFVRPHARGTGERDVVYRSRSALQCLYETTAGSQPGPSAPWFRFESSARRAVERLGLRVEYVAPERDGGGGVEVHATRDGDASHSWIVQCKDPPPRIKLRPGAVRALASILASSPDGTRGILMTTGAFSSSCAVVAAELGIRLIDGAEIERLLAGE